ncbi:helix-turn-helix domain-containing protein [Macrococcus sp. PK]|uniref:helix-turn-helix domain-containing protein n=1 Tax=Macrococcus sp. PK TaxID=2801919 RepID=UPI001F0E0D59|nr:helix-turn-helix domain-containing protein [Macrococcus sp. PK]MCH4984205.1 HNH endonuclease [Macrococcus sp. PK]
MNLKFNGTSPVEKELVSLLEKGEAKLYESLKQVDIYGCMNQKVFSHNRNTGKVIEKKQTFHKGTGYNRVKVGDKPVEVHRIMGELFVYNPQPNVFDTVDHICQTDKTNNCPRTNLRWTTRGQNIKYHHEHQRKNNITSSKRFLTMDEALEIRMKHASGTSIKELAKEYDKSYSVIYQVVNNITYINL